MDFVQECDALLRVRLNFSGICVMASSLVCRLWQPKSMFELLLYEKSHCQSVVVGYKFLTNEASTRMLSVQVLVLFFKEGFRRGEGRRRFFTSSRLLDVGESCRSSVVVSCLLLTVGCLGVAVDGCFWFLGVGCRSGLPWSVPPY